jgi:hypothetical protein
MSLDPQGCTSNLISSVLRHHWLGFVITPLASFNWTGN